jgi:hypothetical protein
MKIQQEIARKRVSEQVAKTKEEELKGCTFSPKVVRNEYF